MTRLALAFAAGAALPLAAPSLPAVLPLLFLPLAPILLWRRPGLSSGLLTVVLAGAVSGWGWQLRDAADCRLRVPDGWSGEVTGRFHGRPGGGAVPFQVAAGLPEGCRGALRVVLREGVPPPRTGEPVVMAGRWRRNPDAPARGADLAGTWVAAGWHPLPEDRIPPAPVLRARGRIQDRIHSLFGEEAPMAEALILARREGVDPRLREAFALSGTAHLMAISGFHVGVVAGILFTVLRGSGRSREGAAIWAAVGAWGYVLSIGAPHAAARAATLVTTLALARVRGRPVHRWGALGSCLLFLLVLEPGAVGGVGFQLSFAGTAGIVGLRRPLEERIFRDRGERVPSWARDGVTAGVAATLGTLPLVAWHFQRVSLVGIPATLLLGPVVAVAIPGIFLSLLLSVGSPGAGSFAAGGVQLLLRGIRLGVEWSASLPLASLWTPSWWVPAAAAGGALVLLVLRGVPASRLGPGVRRGLAVAGGAATLLLVPAGESVLGRGALKLVVLDVGQGDAVAVRTPAGRWIVVDTGPRSGSWDAGERVLLPYLRRHGARRVELLLLTHPHLDHIGGAEALLRGIPVGRVADPGFAAGREFYLGILGEAVGQGVGWWSARAGESVRFDGVELEILHPVPGADTLAPSHGLNSLSVVVLLRYGAFSALLTGDAPAEVERLILEGEGPGRVQFLKVGHHGSRTSTDWELLEALLPEVAVIPVGRGNRFGHPHPLVLSRLERAGVQVFRSDLDGTVQLRVRDDGSYRVRTSRSRAHPPPPPRDLREEEGGPGSDAFPGSGRSPMLRRRRGPIPRIPPRRTSGSQPPHPQGPSPWPIAPSSPWSGTSSSRSGAFPGPPGPSAASCTTWRWRPNSSPGRCARPDWWTSWGRRGGGTSRVRWCRSWMSTPRK